MGLIYFFYLEQTIKVFGSIPRFKDFIEDGIVTFVNEEHPLKTFFPIDFKLHGKDI